MKKLILIISFAALLILPSESFAAIAFTNAQPNVGSSWAINCTGSNTALIVFAWISDVNTASATWDGIAMSQLTVNDSTGIRTYTWGLTGASTSQNIVIALHPGTNTTLRAAGLCYSGVSQIGLPDSSNVNFVTASAGSLTGSTVVVASNAWLVGAGLADANPLTVSGFTSRTDNSGTEGGGTYHVYGDSNGTVGTGSQNIGNVSWSGSQDVQFPVISLAPFVAISTFIRHRAPILPIIQ